MINRPSYAQRTLEVTRRSLQHMPSNLSPAVSGVIVIDRPPADERADTRPASACGRLGGLASLQRWKRKGTGARMAVR